MCVCEKERERESEGPPQTVAPILTLPSRPQSSLSPHWVKQMHVLLQLDATREFQMGVEVPDLSHALHVRSAFTRKTEFPDFDVQDASLYMSCSKVKESATGASSSGSKRQQYGMASSLHKFVLSAKCTLTVSLWTCVDAVKSHSIYNLYICMQMPSHSNVPAAGSASAMIIEVVAMCILLQTDSSNQTRKL